MHAPLLRHPQELTVGGKSVLVEESQRRRRMTDDMHKRAEAILAKQKALIAHQSLLEKKLSECDRC